MHTRHSQAMSQYLAPCTMFAGADPTRHELIMPMRMPGVMNIRITTATVAI